MTDTKPTPPVEKPAQEATVVDAGSVRPEDYVCFGTFEAGNQECKKCQFSKQCEEKASK